MSGWQWAFAIWAAFTGTVGALMGLARTPPDVAVSNLSEWARKIGFHRIPGWLRDRRADEITYRWAARALVALILVGIVGVGIYLTSSRTALTIPSVLTPLPPTQTQPQPTPAIPERREPTPQPRGLPELTHERKVSIVAALTTLKSILPFVVITTDGNSNIGYAAEIAELFGRSGIESNPNNVQTPSSSEETGVMISVKHPNSLTEAERRIYEIFRDNGLEPKITQLPAKIGAEFTVFIGPNPL